MALANGTLFNCTATATTGNVNGAGFNVANANFFTNYTVDAGTGNTSAPVLSSASYNFVAGDVGSWVYVKTGTNWYARTWFQIASVASNKATLNAAIGAGFTQDATNPTVFTPTTVAGVASTGTPTSGTIGIDYSLADTAVATATDFAMSDGSTLLSSASNPFRPSMVGNLIHITTTGGNANGVTGWYEIVSYTNAGVVTLDRTQQSGGGAMVTQTAYIGGAGRLNGLEDAMLEALPVASQVWVKNGSYTLSGAVSVSASAGTTTSPNWIIGYNSMRGDACNGSNRPLIVCGSNAFTMSAETNLINLRFTTTSSAGVQSAANSLVDNCFCMNTSATANLAAFTAAGTGATTRYTNCEAVSLNGRAWTGGSVGMRMSGCYAHDSDTGFHTTTGFVVLHRCKAESCTTVCFDTAYTGGHSILDCTFYGSEAKRGIGCRFTGASSTGHSVINCIFYGLVTGISCTVQQAADAGNVNTFYNNTTNYTNWLEDPHSLAVDPGFVGASQVTGTTATTSGSVLTQSGGDFSSVTDNVDVLHVYSGTGVTVARYLITSHTSTTLTVNNALGTSSAGNVVYSVPVGHNHSVGTALKGLGACSFADMGMEDRSYHVQGAMQRQESTASGGGGAMIVRIP